MRNYWVIFILIFLSISCKRREAAYVPEKRTAKGNVKLGGVFHCNETEYFRSLYPQNVTEVVGHRITNQLYEGLVHLDQSDLSVKPCLAYRWEISDSAKTFTFHLRQNVFFHHDACFENGKGRKMTAYDFEFCLVKLCTPDPNNQGADYFKDFILGASDYFEKRIKQKLPDDTIEGIKAIDDSTLIIKLNQPFGGFLFRLAMPFAAVFPKEAFVKYGIDLRDKAVGTGPFKIRKVLPDIGVFLVRNENYWDKDSFGNQLPYLDGIRYSFVRQEKVEMLDFKEGKLEMKYRLPMDMMPEIIDIKKQLKDDYKKFQLQVVTEMSTQYYGFLTIDSIFKNVHLRRAFNYAIDRKRIIDYTLKGAGTEGVYGVVPLGMPGYNYSRVHGYSFDLKKAKEELALAGYPNGTNFPGVTLHINSGGGRNEKIAEAIAGMLNQNLNVKVDIEQALWAQHTENLETGKYQFWRLGWVADYPDPENFLNIYYGKHVPAKVTDKAYINSFRYKNPAYDRLFKQALATADFKQRTALYEELDNMAVQDAPTLVIFYPVTYRLLQPWVRNFPANGMEYRLLKEVWLDR